LKVARDLGNMEQEPSCVDINEYHEEFFRKWKYFVS
jgi:hypothetical protein